jgi:hypothetical protein
MMKSATCRIHYFATTAEAYDASQSSDCVEQGDILVIESEKVVGIATTWPFAITPASGKLHSLTPGFSASDIAANGDYPDHSAAAVAIAESLGFIPRANLLKDPVIVAAVIAIAAAADRNSCIDSASLRAECIAGDIGGWMHIPAIRACTFSQWTAAMMHMAACLELNEKHECRWQRNYNVAMELRGN